MNGVAHVQCLRVLNRLISEEGLSWVFMEPVDPNQFVDYRDIVKTPMDFGTIKVGVADAATSPLC